MAATEIITKITLISIGSILGGNARYWLGSWAQSRFVTQFPVGTFLVNILGAFLVGLITPLIFERVAGENSESLNLLFTVGVLGAFTTFSTLEKDTVDLLSSGEITYGLLNGVGSLLCGLLAVVLGNLTTKLL